MAFVPVLAAVDVATQSHIELVGLLLFVRGVSAVRVLGDLLLGISVC